MKTLRRASRASRPTIEALEDRIVLATHVWVGPAAGGVWSNAANWTNGVPTTGEANGTIVQFDGNISSTDNIAGLVVNQIHFTAGGNTIFGSGGVTLGLNGTGVTNNFINDAGDNLIDSTLPIALSGATPFFVLTAGKVTIGSNISGSAGFKINTGSANGTLQLAGQTNTYTGTTTVAEGTLELNSPGFSTAIPGDLVIGDNSGGTATVTLVQGQEISDTSDITVNRDGILDLTSHSDTIASLTLVSGASQAAVVQTGTGTLTLGGNVTLTLNGGGGTAATISGSLGTGGAQRTFTVANGGGTSDLVVSAKIVGSGGLVKAGSGMLELANTVANTYTGDFTVNDGSLFLNSTAPSGAITGALVVGDNTGAVQTAVVRLFGSNQIADASSLTLHTDGLLDLNGFDETFTGLSLESGTAAAGFVTTGAGKLALSGNIATTVTGTGAATPSISGNLELAGASPTINVADGAANTDLVILAAFTDASNGFTKTGNGSLMLRGLGPTAAIFANVGTLLLNGTTTDIIRSSLAVGANGTAATVQLLTNDQISTQGAVILGADGTLDLNNFSDVIGTLSVTNGTASASSVTTGTGTLKLSGNFFLSGVGTGATGTVIQGKFDPNGLSLTVPDTAAAVDLTMSAQVVGAGGYYLLGGGTMEQQKSGTGPVNVLAGTLLLNSNGTNDAVQGNLTIGGASPATVKLLQALEIADGVQVTVDAGGVLDLNNFSDSFTDLILDASSQSSATVTTGTGTLTLKGSITATGPAAATSTSTISGKLALSAGDHTFDIGSSGGSTVLITATISGTGGFTKTGTGTLELNPTTNATFTGDTVVANGTLYLTAPAASSLLSENIIIGDDTGAPGSAEIKYKLISMISNTATVTVKSDGVLNMNSKGDTIGHLEVLSGGIVDLGTATLSPTAGAAFAANSVLRVTTGGTLNVTGTVALGGFIVPTFTGLNPVGTISQFVTNDSNDAITGTFANLAEGAVIGNKAGLFKVSYIGGTGNDFTLTHVDATGIVNITNGGKTATFTDIDGDLVTVKVAGGKGTFAISDFSLGGNGAGLINGYQLQSLSLQSSDFTGGKITITAKPTALGGNGHVNVGSFLSGGKDLAGLTIAGDIGILFAGDGDAKVPGIGTVVVDSIGAYAASTQGVFGGISVQIGDGVGIFTVKGDVRAATLGFGKVGTLAIGGSFISGPQTPGSPNNFGTIDVTSAKTISIGGSLQSVDATTGRIYSTGDLGAVTVGLDITGSAKIEAFGKLGAVTVKGGIIGASVAAPAIISGGGSVVAPKAGPDIAIGSISVAKSVENLKVLAGYDLNGTGINADAVLGKFSVGGDFRASSVLVGADPGQDGLFGTADDKKLTSPRDVAGRFSTIASIVIKGQAIGSIASGDVFGIVAEQIVAGSIGGVPLKLKTGPRSASDAFPLGFASSGPGNAISDLFLREISI